MSNAQFVHLRAQSAFSMLEGSMRPADIARACARHAMPAAALTDRNVMFGIMEFADELMKLGVQPVTGCLLSVARPLGVGHSAQGKTIDSLVFLAQTPAGYLNLSRLVSRAHLGVAAHEPPHMTLEQLEGETADILCLTGGGEGALARLLAEDQEDGACAYLEQLCALFPDRLYIELTRTGLPEEDASDARLIELAHRRGLPLVATNPVLYSAPDFLEAHDAMLCIAHGRYVEESARPRSNPHCWFKPPETMTQLFADVPEAISNSLVVARRCAVAPPKRKPILPRYSQEVAESAALNEKARSGLDERLAAMKWPSDFDPAARAAAAQPYRERLDYELGVISHMGFPGYFLIVADFIQWAKAQGIPVGPGRGSGAGSVVAWALRITDLDPLRLGLLFERFLNPERVSMPDFDIDFCETRRGDVIRYVQERYGRAQVAQIITFGKLKARQVVKDVGRVLQMGYNAVDAISKLIPNNPAAPVTLGEALASVPELAEKRDKEPGAARLFDIALKLEGLYRHASTHAAGVVIGDRPLDELVPLYRDPKSDMAVTQFDMKYAEYAGLVKFDFLGLKTLSVLQRAVDLLAGRGIHIDLMTLPWDDKATYDLLGRGETVGVFQLESEGMRRTLALVKPDKFEDIIALVALYRPGPMDNIPSFANRKQGRETVDYLHPLLEPVLRETYGVIIYQEQVMQIAQILAGYSLGEADLLRRAMGKKKKEEMDAQKSRFLEGAARNGISTKQADFIFELVNKFAGYGFNKSHAAAYALISYQTAWLKANHPLEFFAASMAYDINQTEKLAIFVDDMKRLNAPLLPPDINRSAADFSVERTVDGWAVRYALGALKGVGEKAMAGLVAARQTGGPFASLADFTRRIDAQHLNKKQLESLVLAGAFDALTPNRAGLHAIIDRVLSHCVQATQDKASAQVSLFGEDGPVADADISVPAVAPWSLTARMEREREAFGFFFSAHPVDHFRHVTAGQGAISHAAAMAMAPPPGQNRTGVTLAAQVEAARWRNSAKGTRYLMADLSDGSGQFSASAFDDDVQIELERAAKANDLVLLRAELYWQKEGEPPRITVRSATSLDALAANSAATLSVRLRSTSGLGALAAAVDKARGGNGAIRLTLAVNAGERLADVKLPGRFRVDPSLCAMISALPGVDDVVMSDTDVRTTART